MQLYLNFICTLCEEKMFINLSCSLFMPSLRALSPNCTEVPVQHLNIEIDLQRGKEQRESKSLLCMLNDKEPTTSDTNYSSIQDKHTWGDLKVGSGLVLTEGRLRDHLPMG